MHLTCIEHITSAISLLAWTPTCNGGNKQDQHSLVYGKHDVRSYINIVLLNLCPVEEQHLSRVACRGSGWALTGPHLHAWVESALGNGSFWEFFCYLLEGCGWSRMLTLFRKMQFVRICCWAACQNFEFFCWLLYWRVRCQFILNCGICELTG